MAAEMRARTVVFHAGYYRLQHARKDLDRHPARARPGPVHPPAERNPVRMRIETMGKASQFGSLDEVLTLCQELDGLRPLPGLLPSFRPRTGKANSYLDFSRILRKVEKRLGREALRRHPHPSLGHRVRPQRRDPPSQPVRDGLPLRRVDPGGPRSAAGGDGHLREPGPGGRRPDAQRPLRKLRSKILDPGLSSRSPRRGFQDAGRFRPIPENAASAPQRRRHRLVQPLQELPASRAKANGRSVSAKRVLRSSALRRRVRRRPRPGHPARVRTARPATAASLRHDRSR